MLKMEPGESAWLWRRRLRLRPEDVVAYSGARISLDDLQEVERGERPLPLEIMACVEAHVARTDEVMLLRRRVGRTSKVARLVGVSKDKWLKMEKEEPERARQFLMQLDRLA